MSDKRYEANIIRATAVEPANNLQTTSAPGVWSIDEVVELQKKDKWPTVGNVTTDVTDVFSTFLYDGTGAEQNIENGIALGNANDGGSVEFDGTGDYLNLSTPVVPATGQFSLEAFIYPTATTDEMIASQFSNGTSGRFMFRLDNGKLNFNWAASELTDANSITANAWSHCLVTRDASNVIRLFVNGALRKSTTNSVSFDQTNFTIGASRPASPEKFFNGFISNVRVVSGAIPTDYQTSSTTEGAAIYTTPTSGLTAVSNTALLTCQGSTPLVDNSSNSYAITSNADAAARAFGPFTGSSGEGGMVWIKNRDSANGHNLEDTVRGAGKSIYPNTTDEQYNLTGTSGLGSFNSNGFTIIGSQGRTNTNGDSYVGWTFRKQAKFFDFGTISFDSSGVGSYSHNLGVTPGMVIFKLTNTTGDWFVWHKDLTSQNYAMFLNSTAASSNQGGWATYTDTTVSFNSGTFANDTAVVYLFAHNNNDGEFGPTQDQDIIKCADFTTDGSENATVTLGFEPQWVLWKPTATSSNWKMFDAMRGMPVGGNDALLEPDGSGAETAGVPYISPTPTGFNVTNMGASKHVIFMAIRRGPLAEPTSATNVFSVKNYVGTTSSAEVTHDVNFDLEINANRDITAAKFLLVDKLRDINGVVLQTASTAAETAYPTYWSRKDQFTMYAPSAYDGYWAANSGSNNHISYGLRRAPGFFDACTYTGTGPASGANEQTITHSLGVKPEMLWIKKRSGTGDWWVFTDLIDGSNDYSYLNSTNAFASSSNNVATSTQFSVGGVLNTSSSTYVAYLFGTVANVSKVGTFSHTSGQTQNIDCGFSSGARFILVKQHGSTGNWFVYDTVRGIVAGNDPRLQFNTTATENTSNDDIDPLSSGFTLTTNFSGGDYIFFAIA